MLWSGNNGFVSIAITDSEHPGPSALAENGSRQAVETAVGHSLLDTGITDNVHPVADLESLNDAGARGQPAFSEIFLELIPCFLSWTIVMCHVILPPSFLQPA